LTGLVPVGASSLAVLALLAIAVSLVAFLYRTSRHRSSGAWAVATGGFLVLALIFGGISNAVARHAEPTPEGGPSSASYGVRQTDRNSTVKVTRVVDGDTI
jgi:endonuclease YncB( thermonuclease family)